MKKLDLEQMGVQEMDAVEIKEVEGGFPIILLLLMIGQQPEEPGANGYMGCKL